MTRPVTTPGRLVAGRYRLQSQLGGGGMGTVWLARDELLGRQVAVKQVLTQPGISEADADQQRQRALREGRIAARLSHPHAISVYDVALESGQPWLVMEYLPSRSLAEVLTEDGVLRADQVAQIGAQVADALAATHAAGIVHRDVKPANILIGEGGRIEGLVKITDFGISHASGDVTLTQTGQITGTPAYLAPEVARGHEMTAASDVFSLGATLYTCIEGQPPFGVEDNALAMLHRVAGGSPLPPRRAGSLTGPLQRMLAVDPAERPTMAEIRDSLATLAAGRDGDTTTILMARTDLRSNAPNRTAALVPPVGDDGGAPPHPASPPTLTSPPPAPAPLPAAAAAPAAAPPAAGPGTVTPTDRPRRGRLWVAAALAALLLVGLIAFFAFDLAGDGDEGGTTAAEPTPSTSAPAPTSQESPEPEPTTEAPPTEEPTVSEPPAAQDPATAVTEFFALVPGDLATAHQLTSPAFQARFPLERWRGFWDDYSAVQIGNVQTESATTALVDITYVQANGSSTTERHRITFVEGQDGRLLMDSDVMV